jgi:LmbE family N-acetylglucosaminyl deacetylase
VRFDNAALLTVDSGVSDHSDMLEISTTSAPACVLLLGAHCDDIEIGCGATVALMAAAWPETRFVWVTLSSDEVRAAETRRAAERILAPARRREINIAAFRGSYLPHDGPALKDYFESLKTHDPQIVLTHYRHDLHQDHRVTNELTWNTFRNHFVLEYEIPKFDGDLGVPNTFVPVSRAAMKAKVDMLLECFPSQRSRTWFTADTFEALARLRGIECNAPEGFAEAFYARKTRLAI